MNCNVLHVVVNLYLNLLGNSYNQCDKLRNSLNVIKYIKTKKNLRGYLFPESDNVNYILNISMFTFIKYVIFRQYDK
jgi:hypothetical protein